MLSTFSYIRDDRKYYFLWEIEGGSLHLIDYNTYLVERHKSNMLTDDELNDYLKLKPSLINEIEDELISLEQSGLINMSANEAPAPKRTELKALCLHICHDCNLSCKYCFGNEGTYNTDRDYMSEDVGCRAIDFLIQRSGKRKHLEVDFFGGEPLMNIDVVKSIVKYAEAQAKHYDKFFSFTLTTNGLLLNDDIIDFLNDKIFNVVISIDGQKDTHNRVRPTRNGKDCYDIIIKNALNFVKKRRDKSYYIRGTYTSLNTDFYKDVLHLADNGFRQISIEPVVLPKDNSLAIKDEHIEQILLSYEMLANEYIIRRANEKSWFNFFHFMIDLDNGPCLTKRLTGCGAGCEYLAVSPVGEIYPCHQFVGNKQFIMGSVLDNTFNAKIQNEFSKVNVLNKPLCKDCIAKYFCSGGCIANSYNYHNDINHPYTEGCSLMRKRMELSLAIYAIENYNI